MRVSHMDFEGLEKYLLLKGYTRYNNQKYRNEDFVFWKSFDITYDDDEGKKIGYQVGLLFYDTSKYNVPDNEYYGVQFEFIAGDKIEFDRVDFTISDDITIYRFEEICVKLYEFLKNIPKDPDIKLLENK